MSNSTLNNSAISLVDNPHESVEWKYSTWTDTWWVGVDIMVRIRFCSKLGRQLTEISTRWKLQSILYLKKKKNPGVRQSRVFLKALGSFGLRDSGSLEVPSWLCVAWAQGPKYQLQTQLSHPIPSRRKEEKTKSACYLSLTGSLGCCLII